MRNLIVLSFISLDGIMQAPGGDGEDTTNNFEFGGWTVPFFDESTGNEMGKQMSLNFDLLLGRKTYEIFSNYWPKHVDEWPQADSATKYVVSSSLDEGSWEKTEILKSVEDIKKLKQTDGPDLQVHGSSNLIQTLLKEDLVDELWLKFFPITLGKGKRLFGEGTIPAAFKLIESKTTPSGVIFASYKRVGEVQTGNF